MTLTCKAELDEVVELQVEVAAFYKVLKSKCDRRDLESPFEDLKDDMQNWMGNHL